VFRIIPLLLSLITPTILFQPLLLYLIFTLDLQFHWMVVILGVSQIHSSLPQRLILILLPYQHHLIVCPRLSYQLHIRITLTRRLIRSQSLVLSFDLQFHWMGVFQEIYEVAGPYARPSSSQSLNSSHHHSHNHTKYPRLLVPPEETRRRSVKSGHNIHPLFHASSESPIFHYPIDYYDLPIFVNHQTSSSAVETVLQQ